MDEIYSTLKSLTYFSCVEYISEQDPQLENKIKADLAGGYLETQSELEGIRKFVK